MPRFASLGLLHCGSVPRELLEAACKLAQSTATTTCCADRFDSSEAYEGRQEYSLHSGAKEAVTAERVAQEGALTGSESQGMSDGAAGDGGDTRSGRRACRRESAGTTHAALDPTCAPPPTPPLRILAINRAHSQRCHLEAPPSWFYPDGCTH